MKGYKKYHPIDSLESPRFCGIKTFLRLPNKQTTKDIDFAIVGIPFDTACTYRTGARFAPASIRNISSLIRLYNPNLEIDVFKYVSGVDYGDINVVPGYIEDSYDRIEEGIWPLVNAEVVPISLGGDHSITLPQLRAVSKKYGPVALVHLDSHSDTGDTYFGRKYNHGTPFRRACEEGLLDVDHSISVGLRGTLYSSDDFHSSEKLGIKAIYANKVRDLGIKEVGSIIRERVGDKKAFFTFDIDFVDPAYAPGTGVPEVEGFTGHETLSLIRETKGIDFVGFDIVEVLPAFDPTEITAHLAAHVGFEFVSLIAVNKRMEEK